MFSNEKGSCFTAGASKQWQIQYAPLCAINQVAPIEKSYILICSIWALSLRSLKCTQWGLPYSATHRSPSIAHSAIMGLLFHCMRRASAHSVHGWNSTFLGLAMPWYVLYSLRQMLPPMYFRDGPWSILRRGVQVWFAAAFSLMFSLTINLFILAAARACLISFLE